MSNGAYTELACCRERCGEVIVAHAAVVARWRETHETFHCPAGHGQHFLHGRSPKERRIAELERQVTSLTDGRDWWRRRYEGAVRACPWVACGFVAATGDNGDRRALHNHMRAAHGMPTLAALRDAEEAAS